MRSAILFFSKLPHQKSSPETSFTDCFVFGKEEKLLAVFSEREKTSLFIFFHFSFEAVVADAPVRGTAEELDAFVDHLTAEIGIAETDRSAVDIVLLTDGGKFVNGGKDFRAAELPRFADAVTEVRRPEEKDIDSFD